MSISTIINAQTIVPFTKENKKLITEYLNVKIKVVNRVNRHNKYKPEKPNLATMLHGVNYAQQNMDDCHKLYIKLSNLLLDESMARWAAKGTFADFEKDPETLKKFHSEIGESASSRWISKLERYFLTAHFGISDEETSEEFPINAGLFTLEPTSDCVTVKEKDKFYVYECSESYLTMVWADPVKSVAHIYYYEKSFFLDDAPKRNLPKEIKAIKDKKEWMKKASKHAMNQLKTELEKTFTTVLLIKND